MNNSYVTYQGNCLDIVSTISARSVDAIITDLPYGTKSGMSWDVAIPFESLWMIVRYVLKSKGVFISTAYQPYTSMLIMSNLKWFKHHWVWEKSQGTNPLTVHRSPMKCHEDICVFSVGGGTYNPQMFSGTPYKGFFSGVKRKGDSPLYSSLISSHKDNDGVRYPRTVLKFKSERGQHPTQKPVTLYEYLIRTYTNPGDVVLDICMGSGTTGVACKHTGRSFIGVELDETYYQLATKRILAADEMV